MQTTQFDLRPATQADAAVIRHMIWQEHLNPMSLNWSRFLLAVTPEGEIIGCGQVKGHGDGTRELASIVTEPGWRGQGVASAVIRRLMDQHSPPLYLTCRRSLEPFYARFGFHPLEPEELPPYFRRLWKLVNGPLRWFGQPPRMSVMRWG